MELSLEPRDGDGPSPEEPGPLDDLRAVFTAIDSAEAQTEVFDVEGSRAAVRYRRMSRAKRLAIFRRVRAEDGADDLDVNLQFLIEACDEILVRRENGELEPVLPGSKVTFDFRPGESIPLHQALGVPESDVRRSVLRIFQGVDEAALRHAEQVDAWMSSVRDLSREKFAGG